MKYTIPEGNFTKGRGSYKPEACVIHIMQGSLGGTAQWFQGANLAATPSIQSSSHIGIGKNGQVDDYVDVLDTAYHAGRINAPIWSGMKKTALGGYVNPNNFTIGIECEGFRGDIWTEEQIKSIVSKVKEYSTRFGFPITRATIVSHNEITADKEDMTKWCDEIVKRCHTEPTVAVVDKNAIKKQIADLLAQL